ncbi:hypothetical protein JXB31_03000 [Candidatus Woesearchaeota archaeon]|nr:hypothetical protein [Candidatus Woesearchaeota archaeon]
MERYELALEKAKKEIGIADHMINVTYKLVNDPKMLISVISRVMDSLTNSLAAVLLYEREYKRIPPFEENFDSMFNLFKARCTRRYNVNIEYITLIQEIRDITSLHKKSPVEFTRQDRLVICNDRFRIKTVSIDNIKNYINKAKLFIRESENMVRRNAGRD